MAGRVALLTGASRGIGRYLAGDLVDRGWQVGALARDSAALEALAAQCPAGHVMPLVADVTDAGAVAGAVAALGQRWAVPDLLVANAGVLQAVGPTWQVAPEQWWQDMTVNVLGVVNTLHAVMPGMVGRGSGRVVVMSSGLGHKPSPWSSAYGASKAALSHLTASVAGELAGSGVSIFAISPGMVRTEMTDWPPGLVAHRPDLADLPDSAYLPPSQAAELVADLASGRYDALSGHFIHVRADRAALLAEARHP